MEVDLLSTTLFALANQASNWLTAGVVAGRMGNRHPSIAPYETLRAADGPFVVAVGNDEQFATFCDVLGVPALAADERFTTNAARVTNRERARRRARADPRRGAHGCLDRPSRCGRDPLRDGQSS